MFWQKLTQKFSKSQPQTEVQQSSMSVQTKVSNDKEQTVIIFGHTIIFEIYRDLEQQQYWIVH